MAANPKGVVNIHGKEYETVASRVQRFVEDQSGLFGIHTELVLADEERVVMKASIVHVDTGNVQATGYAEEFRDSSKINKTSALENCETSAIGRALAAFGYAGTEYASADELVGALGKQAVQEHLDYIALCREYWDTIAAAKAFLVPGEDGKPNIEAAREVLKKDMGDKYVEIWKAPTKGGIFTTQERDMLKQPEKYQ